MFLTTKTKINLEVFPMNNITQDLMFKQSVVEYSLKYGVTRASIQYEVHRKTIYRWREKYDGNINSLRNKSRRPKSQRALVRMLQQ